MPSRLSCCDEFADALHGFAKGLRGANLRADVDADSVRLKPAIPCCALVDAQGLADVDAELVLAQAGGDVGMRVGEDVGIDAQGEAGDALEFAGAGGKQGEFGFALDVELEDAGVEREVDFRGGLADAGEDDAADGFGCGGEDALKFAAGDDVETRAMRGEELEDGERGVGFDGVADEVIAAREGLLKEAEALGDLVGGVDVERGPVAAGKGFERDFAAVQGAAGLGVVEGARGWRGDWGTVEIREKMNTLLSLQHSGDRHRRVCEEGKRLAYRVMEMSQKVAYRVALLRADNLSDDPTIRFVCAVGSKVGRGLYGTT